MRSLVSCGVSSLVCENAAEAPTKISSMTGQAHPRPTRINTPRYLESIGRQYPPRKNHYTGSLAVSSNDLGKNFLINCHFPTACCIAKDDGTKPHRPSKGLSSRAWMKIIPAKAEQS